MLSAPPIQRSFFSWQVRPEEGGRGVQGKRWAEGARHNLYRASSRVSEQRGRRRTRRP